jgi:predicted trehalose synthase
MLRFQSWLRYWNLWVSVACLKACFQTIGGAGIVPDNEESVRVMLRAHVLDRTMNELGHALRNGGGRLEIPLTAMLFLLREPIPAGPAVKTPLPQMAHHNP